MEIEIVKFYPFERNDELKTLKGTLHIFLPDIGIHVRGIRVIREKNKWRFTLPRGYGIDQETKKTVSYPIFRFAQDKKKSALESEIYPCGIEYILKNLYANPLPVL